MATVAALKQSLVLFRNESLTALNQRFDARISELLEQKKQIAQQIRREFDERMEDIDRSDIDTQLSCHDHMRDMNMAAVSSLVFEAADGPPPVLRELEDDAFDVSGLQQIVRRSARNANHNGPMPASVDESRNRSRPRRRSGAHTAKKRGKRVSKSPRAIHCPQCEYSTQHKSRMKLHARVHTGERLYKCRECGKTFTQQSTLTKHTRFHTGERPYKCRECGKGFTQKSTLRQHKTIHTSERPYKC